MFNLATGVGVKAVFANRISVSLQPLGLDPAVGSVQEIPTTYLWYDFAFGFGVTF